MQHNTNTNTNNPLPAPLTFLQDLLAVLAERAVPPLVLELMLALEHGHAGGFDEGLRDALAPTAHPGLAAVQLQQLAELTRGGWALAAVAGL